jgi:hypothetical protein
MTELHTGHIDEIQNHDHDAPNYVGRCSCGYAAQALLWSQAADGILKHKWAAEADDQ